MTQPVVLIIDDEADICELLEITLNRMSLDTMAARSVAEAKNLLNAHHFDLCLTDMRLPDGNGLDLVDTIQEQFPDMPVAVISAHGNMEAAIRALKAGAFDFISKPIDLTNLRALVTTALKLTPAPAANKQAATNQEKQLLGNSEAMAHLRATINKLARSQAPVYIHGESGSGKELVAQLIHQSGPRKDHSFIPVNCSAIPSELMESEFFGHMKGSFTGAHSDKEGLFMAAQGGTLFLDEIAELPITMQVKLLRAIQERSIRPVGSNKEQSVDVRILSATHKNLENLVQEGSFRQDLYYRINVIQLSVPSLRERTEDIPLLATYVLHKIADKHQIPTPKLQPAAIDALQGYAFPGNVRELENILERAATLCEDNTIQESDLHLPSAQGSISKRPQVKENTTSSNTVTLEGTGAHSLEDMLTRKEKASITAALEKSRWNKTEAAKRLGISFRQLRYRIKKLGIE